MLSIKNLNFKIKKKELLRGVNLDAQDGEIVGLIGPNGAGKSTLIKHIATILAIKKDTVILDDVDLSTLNPSAIAKEIAYLSQFIDAPNTSVLEALELGRRVYSSIRLTKEDYQKIDALSKEFELTNLLERDLSTLSGGERQKVMIASALLQEPKVLLLDEPISHLDPKNQLEVLNIVSTITKSKNIISIIVLHDIQHALHYTTRLVMLKSGKILHDIQTQDINSKMLDELFDVESSLHKTEKHIFINYKHKH